MSCMNAPMPDSVPARYVSLPGARRTVNTSTCSATARGSADGAWYQAAMYGTGGASAPNSRWNLRSRSR
jgi:hypothetical protein